MAAFTLEKHLVATFSRNLRRLEGAQTDERTMTWWATPDNQAAFEATRENPVDPRTAMVECRTWLEAIRRFGRPVICGAPSGFDFTFVYYYFQRELGKARSDSRASTCAATPPPCSSASTARSARTAIRPIRLSDALVHTHVALDDAIEQGCILVNMLRANLGLPPIPNYIDAPAASYALGVLVAVPFGKTIGADLSAGFIRIRAVMWPCKKCRSKSYSPQYGSP